jgi:hypothetical protein
VATTLLSVQPVAAQWRATNPLPETRWGVRAVALPDGGFLVAGGYRVDGTQAYATAFVYQPTTNSFTRVGDMSQPRAFYAAAQLPSGRVLIAGGSVRGFGTPSIASVELYDPTSVGCSLQRPP